jgi:SAM-dependent methyltransferase
MKFDSYEFEKLLGVRLSEKAKTQIDSFNIQYSVLSHEEEHLVVKELVDEIFRLDLSVASSKRVSDWNEGWGQNLLDFQKDGSITSLIPRYFGKNKVNRLNQKLVQSQDADFELKMLRCLESWIFDEYLSTFKSIYEFGCGTGHNLVFLQQFVEDAELTGLDWVESSQTLINLISAVRKNLKLTSEKFDYFNPDINLKLRDDSAVFTIASLEQIGKDYEKFVDFLIRNKPRLVIHVEPFEDLLDPYFLLDNLSIQYMRKRNYINGYVEHIKSLEKEGKAKIHCFQRSYIGSKHIDGYTVLIWSPVN